jgi:hypothetical protein
MILQIYTIIHTLISLVAIFTGLSFCSDCLPEVVSMVGRNGS